MCASYGLDPRFEAGEFADILDAELVRGLRTWAEHNANETLRPTGKNLRNLNPVLVAPEGAPTLESGWWGYLVDGEPARFPSINTRSERLLQRPAALTGPAVVPATGWFEMQKPSRTWYGFGEQNHALLGLAALTRRGRTSDGTEFTCYSIIMRAAAPDLAHIHDRMPLLISPQYAPAWLCGDMSARERMEGALSASLVLDDRIRAEPTGDAGSPGHGQSTAARLWD